LAEIRLKTVERGRNSTHGWVFSVPIWVKFSQFGKISANLDDIRPKSMAEIKLRAFDRF
jgi:hypothetical protein